MPVWFPVLQCSLSIHWGTSSQKTHAARNTGLPFHLLFHPPLHSVRLHALNQPGCCRVFQAISLLSFKQETWFSPGRVLLENTNFSAMYTCNLVSNLLFTRVDVHDTGSWHLPVWYIEQTLESGWKGRFYMEQCCHICRSSPPQNPTKALTTRKLIHFPPCSILIQKIYFNSVKRSVVCLSVSLTALAFSSVDTHQNVVVYSVTIQLMLSK